MSGIPAAYTAQMVSMLNRILADNPGADESLFRLYATNDPTSNAAAWAGEKGIIINKAAVTSYGARTGDFTATGVMGAESIVAHEAGHQLERSIVGTSSPLSNSRISEYIISQAESSTGISRNTISRYGSRGAVEALAEAVSDHFVNGSSANPLSNAIYKGLHDRLEVERKNRLNR